MPLYFYHEAMDSVSNIVGQVIHYVYTWLPRTTKNAKERKKNSPQRKKRVNFSESMKEQTQVNYRTLDVYKSSHGFPSTPDASNVMLLRSLANGHEGAEVFSQEFPNRSLEVVGYKFLSNEKKVSKRSALKKWLHQRTNVVRSEYFHLDPGQCHGRRHDLCSREIFECAPKFADSKYQRGHVGLKGRRRLPRKQWSREQLDRAVHEELDSSLVDLNDSLSVIRVTPSYLV